MSRKDNIVIRTFKTHELPDTFIGQIYDLYETVFHERRSNKFFHDQFCNTSKGYSYHAIAFDDGKIVGHNAYVPFGYAKAAVKFTLVLSIDAMVHPDYQGYGIYSRLLRSCEEAAVEEGCKMRVGFPNGNSYPIQMKAFKYLDLGTLDIYFLPLRPGAFNSFLSVLNPLTSMLARFKTKQISTHTDRPDDPVFHRDRTTFETYRYRWFDGDYIIRSIPAFGTFVYRQSSFKGIPALFLMDIYPLSRHNFEYAVRELVKMRPDVACIIYAGKLPFRQSALFKVPRKLRPKEFHFVAKILDHDFVAPEELVIDNWDVNLSSFDLL